MFDHPETANIRLRIDLQRECLEYLQKKDCGYFWRSVVTISGREVNLGYGTGTDWDLLTSENGSVDFSKRISLTTGSEQSGKGHDSRPQCWNETPWVNDNRDKEARLTLTGESPPNPMSVSSKWINNFSQASKKKSLYLPAILEESARL